MSTQVKRRRGTAAENAAFTGAIAELAFLTDTNRLAVHNAVRAGGYLIPTADDLLTGALTRGTASGTDTYALTLPFFPTSYSAGLEVDVTFTNANTTSATLNVNGVGAAGLKDESGSDFSAGQIAAGSRHTFRHNGTQWRRVSGAAGAVKTVSQQVFTASGTYTPSAGMLFCIVEVRGGGGGGGGAASGGGAGGGGGQGGRACERFTAATIGASQTVTIGAAGAAGTAGPTNGGAGGTTSLGSLIQATGGAGGTAGSSASSSPGGAGGVGSLGDFNMTGQAGFNGLAQASNNNITMGGNGGGEGGGRGGYVSAGNSQAGTVGTLGGGGAGGAGAGTTVVGYAGGAGYIIITEYCSQ